LFKGALFAAERFLRNTRKVAPAQVTSVLFLEYMLPLGSVVHMTPAFESIKRSRPEVEVAVATRGLGLDVLRHSPFVDHLIETPDPLLNLGPAVRTLRRELRRRKLRPGCVLTGASDQRTRIALLGILGVNAWRGGFTVHPQIYHRPLAYDPELSLIGNNLRTAKLIGCETHVEHPHLCFSPQEAEAAKALLHEVNPAGSPTVVVVTQTSGGQPTNWHAERFAEVVRTAVSQLRLSVIYPGTSKDADAIQSIQTQGGGLGVSIAGRTSVSELAALLSLSDFVVTLDTGTLHVARSAGVPMVVLATPWQNPLDWLPLTMQSAIILRGEDRDRASVPESYRLDEISSGSVIAALASLVQDYPASAEARQMRLQAGMSDVDHKAFSSAVIAAPTPPAN
jgi:ADP-heptose:LPS heptosyltransferase